VPSKKFFAFSGKTTSHDYHDVNNNSHAPITHDQTWIKFRWEKLSFSMLGSIQEVLIWLECHDSM